MRVGQSAHKIARFVQNRNSQDSVFMHGFQRLHCCIGRLYTHDRGRQDAQLFYSRLGVDGEIEFIQVSIQVLDKVGLGQKD